MKINWKVRFKNKTWVTAFVSFIISTVYQLLAMFEVAPTVTQDSVVQVVAAVVQLLTLLGVLVDPTTTGLNDSERAMEYENPN